MKGKLSLTNVTIHVTNVTIMDQFKGLYEHIVQKLKEWEESSAEDESEKLKKKVKIALKAYRLKNRITQDQLAAKLGVPRMQVLRWESGAHAPRGMAQKILRDAGIIE